MQSIIKMEKNILNRIDAVNCSLQINLKNKSEKCGNAITMSNSVAVDMVSIKTILAEKLPLETVEDFVNFDEIIMNDPFKRNALKILMSSLCKRSSTLKEGIAKILSNIIAKDVQLQYSACGRSLKGQAKRNLSKTAVYECMQDELLDWFKETDPAEIISKTSRWLAGASDRDGGKRGRKRFPKQ